MEKIAICMTIVFCTIMFIESRWYCSSGAINDLNREYTMKKPMLLHSLKTMFILLVGLNSFVYADQKFKHHEYRYETRWNGVPYSIVVPESQYIYDTGDEVFQAECSAIALQVKEICLCPEGGGRVRFSLRPDQNCTSNYSSTFLAGIESIYCDGIKPYAQPDGTCSATPYQQPMPITQSVKNFGSENECPSPYVSD
jgi:hypothetical protein